MLAMLIALGLAAQDAPPMPAYPTLPADLAEAAVQFDRAQVRGDRAALEAVLADDYLLINSRDQRGPRPISSATIRCPASPWSRSRSTTR